MAAKQENKKTSAAGSPISGARLCNRRRRRRARRPRHAVAVPLHAPRRGRDDIKRFMTDFRGLPRPRLAAPCFDLIAEGDHVVGRWKAVVMHTGPAFKRLPDRFASCQVQQPQDGLHGHDCAGVSRNGKVKEEIGLDDGVTALAAARRRGARRRPSSARPTAAPPSMDAAPGAMERRIVPGQQDLADRGSAHRVRCAAPTDEPAVPPRCSWALRAKASGTAISTTWQRARSPTPAPASPHGRSTPGRNRLQPSPSSRRVVGRIVGLHETGRASAVSRPTISSLARLEAAADAMVRHAAQVGAIDQLGRRPCLGRHVHVELLQQRRGHRSRRPARMPRRPAARPAPCRPEKATRSAPMAMKRLQVLLGRQLRRGIDDQWDAVRAAGGSGRRQVGETGGVGRGSP